MHFHLKLLELTSHPGITHHTHPANTSNVVQKLFLPFNVHNFLGFGFYKYFRKKHAQYLPSSFNDYVNTFTKILQVCTLEMKNLHIVIFSVLHCKWYI